MKHVSTNPSFILSFFLVSFFLSHPAQSLSPPDQPSGPCAEIEHNLNLQLIKRASVEQQFNEQDAQIATELADLYSAYVIRFGSAKAAITSAQVAYDKCKRRHPNNPVRCATERRRLEKANAAYALLLAEYDAIRIPIQTRRDDLSIKYQGRLSEINEVIAALEQKLSECRGPSIKTSSLKIFPTSSGGLQLVNNRVIARVQLSGCWLNPILYLNKEFGVQLVPVDDDDEDSSSPTETGGGSTLSITVNATGTGEQVFSPCIASLQVHDFDLGSIEEVIGLSGNYSRIYFRHVTQGTSSDTYYYLGYQTGTPSLMKE